MVILVCVSVSPLRGSFNGNDCLYLFDRLWVVCLCCVLCVMKVGSWLAGMMAFTLTLAHDGNIGK